ncbi:MAG: hypothetical protein ABII12_14605 [Planctomycetota bacterium]
MSARYQGSRKGGLFGDVLVAVCACVLTVAIVGSAVYLSWKLYDRHRWREQIRTVIASLENRTPAELEERVNQLKAMPKLARYVLPEIRRTLHEAESEEQMCAAIQISRAFVDHKKIKKALFRLRTSEHEAIAAAAVEALSRVEPAEEAAGMLGECLGGTEEYPIAAAAADEACAGLVRLGEPGRKEMERRLDVLSPARRLWVVGYVRAMAPVDSSAWLEMFRADEDERVRAAAEAVLQMLATHEDRGVVGAPRSSADATEAVGAGGGSGPF